MAIPWSDVVYLVGLTEAIDDYGFPTTGESERKKVFANKKSIRSSEYYQAKQSGIDLAFTYEIRSIDYDGEEKLYLSADDEEPHEIERTYEKGEFVELICKRKADDHAV
ncbi:hypothetical protein [Oceanobacillus profundus]|uniref:hypothetical protein n=1 Tax=Oceanobacillus profundus TaxID=372463 RepID=UPI0026E2F989|nr:hypothetical protein [Oceanobacillus profundus]MDO6451721.1 hypothetical protein [Oceanobacillus profundus]